jgi:hypothetical protein
MVIGQAPQSSNCVTRRVSADERLSIIPAESSNPVINLAKSVSRADLLPVNLGCNQRDFWRQAQYAIGSQKLPDIPWRVKDDGNFANRDNRYERALGAASGQKAVCRTPPPSLPFMMKVAQKSCIGNHAAQRGLPAFRLDRRPRPASIAARSLGLAFGTGWDSK